MILNDFNLHFFYSIKPCRGLVIKQEKNRMHFRSASDSSLKIWDNQRIYYSFVTAETISGDDSFMTDAKIGLSRRNYEGVKAAMAMIESESCIKFIAFDPRRHKGQKFLVIYRQTDRRGRCTNNYVQTELYSKEITYKGHNIGKPFMWTSKSGCARCCGSFVYWNKWIQKSRMFVFFITYVEWHHGASSPSIVGHFVHELLHALGMTHTQKRPGNMIIR